MEKMKIFMAGGRRCGKSTVLASMYNNSADTLMGTKLSLVANPKLMFSLDATTSQAESYFYDIDTESFVTVGDENSGEGRIPYPFKLQLADKSVGMEVEFVDVPGEFFVDPERFEEVQEDIRTSHAIIIAIDTPCLMEDKIEGKGFGRYHSEDNKVVEITKFIKENLNVEDIQDRLIMFVPIKCEKYFYTDRMPEVAEAIRSGYRDLLTFLANDALKNSCTAVILPMISLGGLKFFEFAEAAKAGDSPTTKQRYIYHDNTVNGPEYKPLFCDQPLLYTIAYLMRMYHQSKKGFWNKLKSVFSAIFSVFGGKDGKALEEAFDKLAAKIDRDESKGFVVIQDPLHL